MRCVKKLQIRSEMDITRFTSIALAAVRDTARGTAPVFAEEFRYNSRFSLTSMATRDAILETGRDCILRDWRLWQMFRVTRSPRPAPILVSMLWMDRSGSENAVKCAWSFGTPLLTC